MNQKSHGYQDARHESLQSPARSGSATQALAWGHPRPEYRGLLADDDLIEQDRQTAICWQPRRSLRSHPDGEDGSPVDYQRVRGEAV